MDQSGLVLFHKNRAFDLPVCQAAFRPSYAEDLRRGSLPFSIQSFKFVAYTWQIFGESFASSAPWPFCYARQILFETGSFDGVYFCINCFQQKRSLKSCTNKIDYSAKRLHLKKQVSDRKKCLIVITRKNTYR